MWRTEYADSYQDQEHITDEAIDFYPTVQEFNEVNKAVQWNLQSSTKAKYSNYLLDSGATCHVTNNLNNLEDIEEVNTRIMVAQNSLCKTTKKGKMTLKVVGLPNHVRVTLQGVYFVQEFNKKIVSVKQLVKDNYKIAFKKTVCKMRTPEGSILKIHNNNDGLFYIRGETHQGNYPSSVCSTQPRNQPRGKWLTSTRLTTNLDTSPKRAYVRPSRRWE